MKFISRSVFISFLLLSGALLVAAQCEKDMKVLKPAYDKTKDETLFFLSYMVGVDAGWGELATSSSNPRSFDSASTGLSRMVVYHRVKGKTFVKPDKVTLGIEVGSLSDYRFSKDRDLSITADGQATTLGRMDLTARRQDGGTRMPGYPNYWETLEASMPLDDYLRIIKANVVNFEIGQTRFSLSEKNLKCLRTIADKELK